MKKTLSLLLALLLILGVFSSVSAYSGTAPTVALELSDPSKTSFAVGEEVKLKVVAYNQDYFSLGFVLSFPSASLKLKTNSSGSVTTGSVFGSIFYVDEFVPNGLYTSAAGVAVLDDANARVGNVFPVSQAGGNTDRVKNSSDTYYIPASASGYTVCTVSFIAKQAYTINKNDFAFVDHSSVATAAGSSHILVMNVSGEKKAVTAYIDLPTPAAANTAPKFKVGVTGTDVKNISAGATVDVNLSDIFEDAEDTTLSYKVSTDNSSFSTASVSGGIYTSSAYQAAGTNHLYFKAVDSGSLESTDVYHVTINVSAAPPTNTQPRIIATDVNAARTVEKTLPETFSLDLTTIFADSEQTSFSYSVKEGVGAYAPCTSPYTKTAAGAYTLKFKANDGSLDSPEFTVNLTINPANNIPKRKAGVPAAPTSTIEIDEGTAYTLKLTDIFTDDDSADVSKLTFKVKIDSASSFSAAAVRSGTYSNNALSVGTHTLVFLASDGKVDSTESYTVTVKVNALPINHAPKFKASVTTTDTKNITKGESVSISKTLLDNVFTDDDTSDILSYKVSTNGISYSPVAFVSGNYVKTYDSVGNNNHLYFKANDGTLDSTDVYTVTVNVSAAPNNRPTRKSSAAATANAEVEVGKNYTLDLSTIFTDPDGDNMTYKVRIGTNPAVTAAKNYSYKPTIAANYTLVFTAVDSKNAESTDTYTVTLTANPAAPTNHAPIAQSPTARTAAITLGETYKLELAKMFTDADGDTLTYNVKIGSGVVQKITSSSYTYAPNAVGTYTLGVTASDKAATSGEITIKLTVSISPEQALADAKKNAISSLSDYIRDFSKYSDETAAEMKQIIEAAKTEIEAAQSIADVEQIERTAKADLDKLKGNSEYEGFEMLVSFVIKLVARIIALLRSFFGFDAIIH